MRRTIAGFALVVLVASATALFAVGQDPPEYFYARPKGECPTNGNGRAYACAAGYGQTGAWSGLASTNGTTAPGTDTVGVIDGGDVLKLCGHFLYDSRDFNGQMLSPGTPFRGVSGNPVTITGNCSAEGRSDEGVIDGEMLESRGLDILGDYVTVRDLTIQNLKDTGISSSFTSESAGTEILNVKINNIGAAPGTSRTCIELNSSSALLDHVYLNGCGGDGIFVGNGSTGNHNIVIRDVDMHGISSQLSSGDGIQMEPGGGSITLQRVKVQKHGNDKACFLVGGGSGTVKIDDIECSAEPGGGPFGGVTFEGAQTGSYIHGAYIHDIPGGTGFYFRDTIAAHTGTLDITGNIVSNVGTLVYFSGVHPFAEMRFYQNTLRGGTDYGIRTGSNWNPGLFSSRNNIIQSSGYNLYLEGTPTHAHSDWDSNYNLWFGVGTFHYLGTNHATLAAYAAASGKDAASKYADPLFVGSADARVLGLSPARWAGVLWGMECKDFRGFACRLPPDIGAYQFVLSDAAE